MEDIQIGLDGRSEEVEQLIAQEESLEITKEKSVPIWKLIALSISFLGVQFGWAIQIAYTSPIFLELGVSKVGVALVWLAGPISGLLVQPVVGVISDSIKTKMGRRRPFIIVGGVCIVIGMVLISNAKLFGKGAVAVAVIGFWILDLANNTVQGPCRALLVDVAPPHQLNLGGSLFSVMLGTGNLLGYFMGSLKLTKAFPFFGTDIRALFTIGIILLIICLSITVILTKEERYEGDKKIPNPFMAIAKAIWKMPDGMGKICAVQFTSWLAWFNFLIYITTWVGENIFGGSASEPEGSRELALFQEGVRYGALGLTLNAVVTVVMSLILPVLTRWLGLKRIFFVCQIILGVCLLCTWFVREKVMALILIAFFGIPWSAIMVFPFTIVGGIVDESEAGLYMGVLNIFVVVPQILVSIFVGFLIDWMQGNVVGGLVFGASAAFLSAVLVIRLKVNERHGLSVVTSGGH